MKSNRLLFVIFFLALFSVKAKSSNHIYFYIDNDEACELTQFGTSQDFEENYCAYVSGPLVHASGESVGGIVYKSKWVSKYKKWIRPKIGGGNFSDTNGIFGCNKNNEFFLKHFKNAPNAKQIKEIKWAFQNGPILLKESKNFHNPDSRSQFFRAGIGFDKKRLIVVASTQPMNLFSFGELFKSHGFTNAIYLEGFPRIKDPSYLGIATSLDSFKIPVIENRLLLQFYSKNKCNIKFKNLPTNLSEI